MTPTALVIEHLKHEGVGALGEWLPEAGLALHTIRPSDGDPIPATAEGYDALVVMGGSMGVADADRLPWLAQEMALLRAAVAAGTPTLAVCLGAQLLAAACGGRVAKGRLGPELGACLVAKRDIAAADPLFEEVPFLPQVIQWHWDEIVDLPPGAMLLAAGATYPHQAFRVGERAWGVQFHLEAHPGMVERWARLDDEGVRTAGLVPADVLAGATEAWPDVVETWRPVAHRFAALAGSGIPPDRTRG